MTNTPDTIELRAKLQRMSTVGDGVDEIITFLKEKLEEQKNEIVNSVPCQGYDVGLHQKILNWKVNQLKL